MSENDRRHVESTSDPRDPDRTELMERALPQGTVTFLFTDVEGSTQLLREHGAAMGRALAQHHRILLEAVEASGGAVFETVGDAVYAAFPSASDGIAAAVRAQLALREAAWDETGPIRVRMGLHTGEVERQGDRHYFGEALFRCARLMAVGYGEQVLVSAETAALARAALPEGASLRDLGEHRLKDFSERQSVYQLAHPQLRAEFPALKSLDLRPHNLPALLSSFVGRDADVAAVRGLIASGARLLTLSGPGGTGKTRLALEVARQALADFEDGAFFVDLAPLTDPALVIPTAARVLGLRDTPGEPIAATLERYLSGKHLLLVLDNFEHVLGAAAEIAALLERSPELVVLATSRARLRLSGEREYAVPPLALPDLRRLPDVAALAQYEAVALFSERANAADGRFRLREDNAAAVAEICHRLDGLPLAIELAAARSRLLPPQALLARLSTRLGLLTGGARDLPERQRTLRAAIDWSHELLEESERRLFRRLAVFAGGCTVGAAEAVCRADGDAELSVLDGLASLTDKGLLRQQEGTGGEPRFTMLETIREYARERLEASGEGDARRRAQAVFFCALAEQALPQLSGPEQIAWLGRLDAEHDNLRAAIATGLASAPALAARLCAALWLFWWQRGHLSEGKRWLDSTLAASDEAATSLKIELLGGAGVLHRETGDPGGAVALHEEQLALARAAGEPRAEGRALDLLAVALLFQGHFDRARPLLEAAVEQLRALDDRRALADALSDLAWFDIDERNFDRASAQLDESFRLQEALGNHWGMAIAMFNGFNPAHLAGDAERAKKLVASAMELFRALGDRQGVSDCLAGFAEIAQGSGDDLQAARLFAASNVLRESTGARLFPGDQTGQDEMLAAIQSRVGAEELAVARAEGRAMSAEQAIAYAISGAPASG